MDMNPVTLVPKIAAFLLAQAGGQGRSPGVDIFAQPKVKPKKEPKPKTVPAPKPKVEPMGKNAAIQAVLPADDLYEEILMLGDEYQRVSEALQREREAREVWVRQLRRTISGLRDQDSALTRRLRQRETEAKRRGRTVAGGTIAAVTVVVGTAVYFLRSHAQKLHQARMQQIVELANAWRTSTEAVAREAVTSFIQAQRAGWEAWVMAQRLPPSAPPVGDLQQAFDTVAQDGNVLLRKVYPAARRMRNLARPHLPLVGPTAVGGMVLLKTAAIGLANATGVVAGGVVVGGLIYYSGLGRYIGTDWVGEKIGDLAARWLHRG